MWLLLLDLISFYNEIPLTSFSFVVINFKLSGSPSLLPAISLFILFIWFSIAAVIGARHSRVRVCTYTTYIITVCVAIRHVLERRWDLFNLAHLNICKESDIVQKFMPPLGNIIGLKTENTKSPSSAFTLLAGNTVSDLERFTTPSFWSHSSYVGSHGSLAVALLLRWSMVARPPYMCLLFGHATSSDIMIKSSAHGQLVI